MQFKSSALVFAAFGVGPLLLAAGCGDSSGDGAGSVLTPIQPSSYVTIEPATTTSTTTIPVDPTGSISPVEQTYKVVTGDSLSKIAERFDITTEALINYNGWPEGTNHLLLPGDVVLIPPNTPVLGAGGQVATDTPSDSGSDTEAAAGTGCVHTIVKDDNPSRVARKYGITVDQLTNANLDNPVWNTFLIGFAAGHPARR